MKISNEAVEAALDAFYWGSAPVHPHDIASMRAAISAAAPHLFAGVTALADDWEARGEYDMAYSKTVADEDIALQLLQSGAQMVDDARLVRNSIGGAE